MLFSGLQNWVFKNCDEIGIDLGTANTVIYVKDRGIVLREPSVVAIDTRTDQVLSVGEDARNMIGKTPGRIIAMKPLKDGVIADYDKTKDMLDYFIKKAIARAKPLTWIFKYRVVIGIPSGITNVEKEAVSSACQDAGARHIHLVEEPMAAAIGCHMAISEAAGNMIVDIGGGTTEVAVISLDGIVTSTSIRIAGDELDRSIMDYARKRYNLQIGERTSERIKVEIGCAHPSSENLTCEIRGMDQVTGLPKSLEINSAEVREAMQENIDIILKAVRETLEDTPPELAADIIEQGIMLAGGGALLRDLDLLISKDTGIVTTVAREPLLAVARGTQYIIEDPRTFAYFY
ncbi:rod shape-determining protein [bacterium]|nr:rod shape-determining protein [bacterium]